MTFLEKSLFNFTIY